MLEYAFLIPLLPFAAAVLILAFGKKLPLEGAWIGIAAIFYGLIHSLFIFVNFYTGGLNLPNGGPMGPFAQISMDWFTVGQAFRAELGVMIDGMSSVLLVVVTLVSTLVQIYSLGYQHGKPRLGRYYAYLSLFTGAMLLLVLANNLLQFFIGWELMGVSSYLLIGFEFERPAAAYSGRKAFITTRIGDLGFYLGILLLFTAMGTANFPILFDRAKDMAPGLATAIALLLFCGSIGKSAQVPLHVWLPDAMEGPTPVSALIHAATMVAAGVYLIARFFFVFEISPLALSIVAWTGGLTALIAASSALTASDIKKVLAYSTISQLGYMVLAMGVGNPQAGMFHLFTHAFFKALLFLGAGSVIHAVHTNDLWQMGGLSKKMPVTFATFAAATLAIIGFPFLSGFYSKEAILAAVYSKHETVLFGMASFTALLTSFYMTRLFVLAFLGDPRDSHRYSHAHESGPSMAAPLAILGLLAVGAGFFFTEVTPFAKWVPGAAEEHHDGHFVLFVSLAALVAGSGGALSMYLNGKPDPAALAKKFPGLHEFLGRRYADEIYIWLIHNFVDPLAVFLAKFDYGFIDQIVVDGVGALSRGISRLGAWVDDFIVDGIFVNGAGFVTQVLGAGARRLQTGFVQFYLLVAALGLSFIVLWAVNLP